MSSSSIRARRRALVALVAAGATVPALTAVSPAIAHPAAHHKHKVDRHHPTKPAVHATGVSGGVMFTWSTSKHATRYRVHWAPAAFDQWPGSLGWMVDRASGGWVPSSRRSSVRLVPTSYATDKTMTALPYGNPLFGQVQANNSRAKRGATTKSGWVMGFPVAPLPGAGLKIRFGTYNINGPGSDMAGRIPVLVRNIADHGVQVASLQEIRNENVTTVVSALSRATGHTWAAARSSNGELEIAFDTTKVTEVASGSLSIDNYSLGNKLATPWVRLRSVDPSYPQEFYVVSVHFVPAKPSDGRYQAANNLDTGRDAAEVAQGMSTVAGGAPVIIAGDMTSNNTHWSDPHPAQPTFVRAGYWDAMAARTKYGIAYGTVNKQAHEAPLNSGLGGRPDAIFLKGFGTNRHGNGALVYDNVANWYGGYGKPPSDHNLVLADLVVPQP